MADRNARIELEALITEREGMIAANKLREIASGSIAYSEDSFFDIANQIRALKDESPNE